MIQKQNSKLVKEKKDREDKLLLRIKMRTKLGFQTEIQPEPSSWGAALPPTHSCSYSEFKCHPHQEVVT